MDRIRNAFRSSSARRSEANPGESSGAGPSNAQQGAARTHATAGSGALSGLRRLASNRSGGDAGAPSSSRPRAAIPAGQASTPAPNPIMALLPRIAAGEPIDQMQIGQSVWLRNVFYDNGRLATTGRAYIDAMEPDDQVQVRAALRARRQLYQQQVAARTTGTQQTPQLNVRDCDEAYTEMEPVLDRFALNEKFTDLANDAPSVRQYLSQAGLHPRHGEAWLANLSGDRQTRVRDAVADRNAIQNIGGARLVAASEVLANPANDLSAAAARIGRSTQDLERLFNDAGLTERGRQYASRLGLDRAATIEYSAYLRNIRRPAIASPAFSLSIPATPASQSEAELNMDAWRAQLMGQPAHASPAAAHSPESSFAMPPTPSGGWGWDLNADADAGQSNWHDGATSAAAPYSREFSLSIPGTPLSDANSSLNLDAWNAQLTGQPAHSSPAQTYSPELSFAMPQTPSGGWGWDLNADADAGPSNRHDEATSAAPTYSREFSLSVPATPASDADLNLEEWHAQLASEAAQPMHAPESPRPAAIPSVAAGPSTQDPILALIPSIAAGVPITTMQAGLRVPVRLRDLFNERGYPLPTGREYRDNLAPENRARFRNALALRRQVFQQVPPAQPPRPALHRYANAPFELIAPGLERFALNEKMKHLDRDVPALSPYLCMYGLTAHGEEWFGNLTEYQQTLVSIVIADRNAIRNLGARLPQISAFLSDPANSLPAAAAMFDCEVTDLYRLFTESGLTERGLQYASRMDPDAGAAVLQNIQLRQSRSAPPLSPAYSLSVPATPSSSTNSELNLDAWQAQLMGEAGQESPAHVDPHDELRSIVDDLGRVPLSELQERVHVPLSEYFVRGEGVTELGHRFIRTLSEQQQMHLDFALRIPGDVMAYYDFTAIRDRFAIGAPRASLLQQAPRVRHYLSESGLNRNAGEGWFQRLPAERQAVVARALADRRIVQAIGPRFAKISSTFSNAANDMDAVARRARVPLQDLNRFLTEDGLTELGEQFVQTCGIHTRQVIEANLALRHA